MIGLGAIGLGASRTSFERSRLAAAVLAAALPLLLAPAAPAAVGDQEIEDSRIENAIEGNLFVARGVSGNEIDVSAEKRVVTLTGTVDEILAKERAARIALQTKGVRSVVDRIEVQPGERSDGEIRKDAIAALAADPATDSWELAVSVEDGVVKLSGEVESYAESELAVKVIKSVRGVRGVDNRIDVEYETQRSDAEIRKEIEERLRWDTRVADALLDVSVEDGVVMLTGTVGSAYERSLARSDAWVAGVESVDATGVEIRWWARDEMQRQQSWPAITDEGIERAVRDAMLYDPRVFSFQPEVMVENGTVTLRGTVDSVKAKRAAAQVAQNTLGVWRVKNLLKVRGEPRTEDAIARDVRNALERDPYVNRYAVDVSVDDGEVHLYGTIDSYFERNQAGDVASRVRGVREVSNHLDVDYEATPRGYVPFYDWDPVLHDYDFDYAFETVRSKSDWELREDIESELFWSPFVDANEVAVMVEDGQATLTGAVDTWSERNAAAENALEAGAYRVVNELDVEYGPESEG